jgi:nucleoside-diphosphate-sugar epimerase
MKKKVLILGGSGRVGRLLRVHLDNCGELDVFYHSYSAIRLKNRFDRSYLTFDLLQKKAINEYFSFHQLEFDVVINLAANINKDKDATKDNLEITKNALKLCRLVGAKRFLYFSSSAVYGNGANINENCQLAPTNYYGKTKIYCEKLISEYSEGINFSCLRLGNIVGADSLMEGLIDNEFVYKNTMISLFENGKGPERSYITPLHLTNILRLLIQNKSINPPHLNVASILKIDMRFCLDYFGIKWRPFIDTDIEKQCITLDCSMLKEMFPQSQMKMTEEEFLNDFKKYLKMYRGVKNEYQ